MGPHPWVPNFSFSLVDAHFDLSLPLCAFFQFRYKTFLLGPRGNAPSPSPHFSLAWLRYAEFLKGSYIKG